MSTGKTTLVLLVILVAFGLVGRMDYEDAKRIERTNGRQGIRLSGMRVPIDASAERSPSKPQPATAILVAISASADGELAARTVFRCVVVEE